MVQQTLWELVQACKKKQKVLSQVSGTSEKSVQVRVLLSAPPNDSNFDTKFESLFSCVLNTTGFTCGSKKLIAMSGKKEPPLLI